jgi:single-strand DNA-binding protein
MQRVQIIGRLGNDPENKNGAVKFSVAVSEKYKDKEKTEWFNIVAFAKLGEVCEKYLKKGSKVYCEGRQSTNEHEGKRYTSIILGNMEMLDSKPKDEVPFDLN